MGVDRKAAEVVMEAVAAVVAAEDTGAVVVDMSSSQQ